MGVDFEGGGGRGGRKAEVETSLAQERRLWVDSLAESCQIHCIESHNWAGCECALGVGIRKHSPGIVDDRDQDGRARDVLSQARVQLGADKRFCSCISYELPLRRKPQTLQR
jgi:hypothetical protein